LETVLSQAERTPKHKFAKAGTYSVTLFALQNGKVIDSMTKQSYITIAGTLDAEETIAGFETSFSVVPNPSYGETILGYTLSQPAMIRIAISDVLGREVTTWSLHEQSGEHSLRWNGSIGMYYCTFRTGGTVRSIPFVIVP
jgi:PKD repeat protein